MDLPIVCLIVLAMFLIRATFSGTKARRSDLVLCTKEDALEELARCITSYEQKQSPEAQAYLRRLKSAKEKLQSLELEDEEAVTEAFFVIGEARVMLERFS